MPEIYLILIIALAVAAFAGILIYFLKTRKRGADFIKLETGAGSRQMPAATVRQQHTVDNLMNEIEKSKPKIEIPREVVDIAKLRKNLMVKVGYRQDVVERLVAFEKKKHPDFSEAELYQAAIDSWERDNKP